MQFFFINKIKKKFLIRRESSVIRKGFSDLKRITVKKGNKVIVFNTVCSCPFDFMFHIDLFLGYVLSKNGYKIYILLDDGCLSHWDSVQESHNVTELTTFHYEKSRKEYYLFNTDVYLDAYRHPNIKIIKYSKIINKNLYINDLVDERIELEAKSSLLKYSEDERLLIDIAHYKKYYDLSISNGIISKKIAAFILDSLKPNLFITSHSYGSVWGPCYDLIRKSGIKSLSIAPHPHVPSEIIISDTKLAILQEDSKWTKFNRVLNEDEKIKVDEYFNSRIKLNAVDTQIYYKDLKNNETNFDFIQEGEGKVFGVFPNILWDDNIKERNVLFDGIIDWLCFTINSFKKSKHKLVIRFHPGENTLFKNTKSLEKIIKEKVLDVGLYSNIHFIASDCCINTYEFIRNNIDIGIIYSSMVGLELVYLEKPVISCGKGVFSLESYTYFPNNKKDYCELIGNPDNFLNNYNVQKVKIKEEFYKYSYWYLFESGGYVPIMTPLCPPEIEYKRIHENLNNPQGLKKTENVFNKIISYMEMQSTKG